MLINLIKASESNHSAITHKVQVAQNCIMGCLCIHVLTQVIQFIIAITRNRRNQAERNIGRLESLV